LVRRKDDQMTRSVHERIQWWLDPSSYGGLLPERLLAALPLGDPGAAGEGLYCGLVLTMSTSGKPTLEFWERMDDIKRQGFVPISSARARAISDAIPRFLDRLEQAAEGPEGV
jgi:hypothetical protein